ncbi:MAG: ATP-binding cassette domain-containing protein, partial [Elusimicrobia bacterium]|nr:ATP-binding cassette domain-containing protein [Elusimicrobiota bacterium]
DDLELRRQIFFLPDFPPMLDGVSMLANLGVLLKVYAADGPGAPERLVDWLQKLDLLELAEKPIDTLSRGQIYKSALAALLTIDPELWLLDEPLASGMDPRGLSVLRSEVRAAAAARLPGLGPEELRDFVVAGWAADWLHRGGFPEARFFAGAGKTAGAAELEEERSRLGVVRWSRAAGAAPVWCPGVREIGWVTHRFGGATRET